MDIQKEIEDAVENKVVEIVAEEVAEKVGLGLLGTAFAPLALIGLGVKAVSSLFEKDKE
jgi:hypothetical protein